MDQVVRRARELMLPKRANNEPFTAVRFVSVPQVLERSTPLVREKLRENVCGRQAEESCVSASPRWLRRYAQPLSSALVPRAQ